MLRSIDLVGRYGGEEFIVLLPETDEQNAVQVGERLRRSISQSPFFTKVDELQITISVGVTSSTGIEEISLEELIEHADQALYSAKRAGRNRVSTRSDTIPIHARVNIKSVQE